MGSELIFLFDADRADSYLMNPKNLSKKRPFIPLVIVAAVENVHESGINHMYFLWANADDQSIPLLYLE
jgi:hypothetical protein